MNRTVKRHLKAIKSDAVDRSNVIGLRKIYNTIAREDSGYSVSSTAPKVTAEEFELLATALGEHEPRVVGALHDSGLKLLQSRRYRSRFTDWQREVIANLKEFRLTAFEEIDSYHHVPVYRAIAPNRRTFLFRNVPWQSGGRGPEIIA